MRAGALYLFLATSLPILSAAAEQQPLSDVLSSLRAELANYDTRSKDLAEGLKQQSVAKLWGEICGRGGAAEAEPMAELYATLPAEWRNRSTYFVGVSELWIAREIEAIVAEHRKPLEFPAVDAHSPEQLNGAPPELIAAWRKFHTATRPGAKALRPWGEGKHVEEKRVEFFGMLDEFLLRGTPGVIEKIVGFSPSFGKGALEENIRETQLRVQFMDALRRRKLDEAVGLAFPLTDDPSYAYSPERDGHFIRLLLGACGLDWEPIFIGALAESGGGPQYKQEWCVRSERLDEELVIHGSPAALRLLVAHEALHPGACCRSLYSLIEAAPGGKKVPLNYPRSRRSATPKDVQEELLALAPKWIALDDGPEYLLHILSVLAPLRRPELAESWQSLVGHVSHSVAGAARGALLAIGAEPRPPETVKLKITLNGLPLANTELAVALVKPNQWKVEESIYPTGDLKLTTDPDGKAELGKWSFVSGKRRPTAIVLRAHSEALMSRMYQVPASYWARESRLTEVKVNGWIERIPLPADLAAPINVDLATQDCAFRITKGADRIKGQRALIAMNRVDGISLFGAFFPLDVGERMTLPGIQSGVYESTILIPGAAEWRGGPFKLAANTPPIDVALDAGADVKISVLPPGSKQAIETFRLIRVNAPDLWYPQSDCLHGVKTYHSLPLGKYTIGIPALAEWKQREVIKDVPAYAAREIAFEITEKTPPVLDLGTIQLEGAR